MGRAAGVSRRRRKTVNFKSKRKLNKQKVRLLKKNVTVANNEMKSQWNSKKSVENNLTKMGLVCDPNKMFKTKRNIDGSVEMEVDSKQANETDSIVVQKLEEQASVIPPKRFKLSPEICKLCVYMMTKHGEDYEKMQMDRENTYQYSAGQIKRLIGKFLSIPGHRRAYERAKAEIESSSTTEL